MGKIIVAYPIRISMSYLNDPEMKQSPTRTTTILTIIAKVKIIRFNFFLSIQIHLMFCTLILIEYLFHFHELGLIKK